MNIDEIIERVNKIPGWFFDSQMRFLYPYAQQANDILEIGTYAGKSTLFWSLCNPNARIVTVDNCIGVPSNGITGATILPEVVNSGNIIAIKENSHDLSKRYTQPIDLAFIDGGHEYADSCQDITDWIPKVKGLLVCHDYMDTWSTVKQACNNCLRGKYELITDQFDLFVVKNG